MNTTIKTLTMAALAAFTFGFAPSAQAGNDDCITFSSSASFTLKANSGKTWNGTLWTSTDKTNWTVWEGASVDAAQTGGAGDYYLYVRGDDSNTKITGNDINYRWVLDGSNISCSGNIETLRGATGEAPSTKAMAEFCYYAMFQGCTALTTAPALPATTLARACYQRMFYDCKALTAAPVLSAMALANDCYMQMFSGCTSLTAAPTLPATTLAEYCYHSMFEKCTALTEAPTLSVMTLAEFCYAYMFSGCSALTTAPVLPATTLAESCYQGIFENCTSLTTAPALPATNLVKKCYYCMFYGCTALTAAPELPATTLATECYYGMFAFCTSLESPAMMDEVTTIGDEACSYMYYGCTNLVVNTDSSATHAKPWAVNATSVGSDWNEEMFVETAGTFKGAPSIGTTYYIKGEGPTPPVTSVEYRYPVYKTEGDPKSGIKEWKTGSVTDYTVVTDQTTWGAAGQTSWYVVASDVTISSRITCLGQVNLILTDGKTLTASAGIKASTSTTDYLGFAVYAQSEGEAMGKLVVTGGAWGAAGIGGVSGDNGANITINGGTVTATGGIYAAGIGGGYAQGANITINGGTVTATGAGNSAGIGGGGGGYGPASDITVNGGTVTATGDEEAAGIGGGTSCAGSNITVNGGTVTAMGGASAAGIGGGAGGAGSNIALNGGTVFVCAPASLYGIGDFIGSGRNGAAASGVVIDSSAKVFFNLADTTMPASFEGFTIKTPETAVARTLVGGIANWTAGKTFNLVNAATAATGTITVDDTKGTVFANKLLKLPHADSKLKLTVENPPPPVEYREPVYKTEGDPKSGIKEWKTGSVTDYTVVTSDMTTWGAAGQTSWYVVASDVTISSRITCVGDVRLILKDGFTLTASAGIEASTSTTDYLGFAVYAQSEGEAMGKLAATGGGAGAGIGGEGHAGSNITVNGGTVTATGGYYGAGIGGGNARGSNIVINGGTVTATGAGNSAGIGGGGGGYGEGSGIVINGGTVTATGDGDAAGIGGGTSRAGSNIMVNGGTVTAMGGASAAGIGGGAGGAGSNIALNGGTVFVCAPASLYGIGDCIGSGRNSTAASGVVIDSSAKVFFNLADKTMPASFEGFTIKTPETPVARTLVGGIANWTAGKTFKLVNAATAATGTITVNDTKGTVFANKLLKLPHADSKLTLTVENPPEPIEDCITFKSSASFSLATANTSKNWNGTLWTSTDKVNWTEWTGAAVDAAQTGDTYFLYVRGNDSNTKITGISYDTPSPHRWVLTGSNIACSGNIETLRGATGEQPSTATMADYCYGDMFYGCTALTSAPALPATTLAVGCYKSMFQNCTSLTEAPALSATTLADRCCAYMFYGCTALTATPTLTATTLAPYCYQGMFYDCTALTAAPALPATALATSCYDGMFYGCTGIKLYENGTGDTWSIPSGAEGPEDWGYNMFKSTGGTLQGQPVPGTTYYYTPTPKYAITYKWSPEAGGTVSGQTSAEQATAVEFTATANEAYAIDSVTAKGEGGTVITVYGEKGSYSFNMPGEAVTVTVTFVKKITGASISGCPASAVVGDTFQLTANVEPSGEGVEPYATTWSSSDAAVATIDENGNVSVVGPGKVEFYAFVTGQRSGAEIAAMVTCTAEAKKYNITIPKFDHGKVTSNVASTNEGATVTLTVTPDEGYKLERILVNGIEPTKGEGSTYTFTMPGEDVEVSATFTKAPIDDCITFSSAAAFSLQTVNERMNWDGTLWTSTDKINWTPWLGSPVDAAQTGDTFFLYVRGNDSNTVITGDAEDYRWALTSSSSVGIACSGNIETLRGAKGEAPSTKAMAANCYRYMFAGCTVLTTAPKLQATNLADLCYANMFDGCTALTEAPALPATNLAAGCYLEMFNGCTLITTAPALSATTLMGECYGYMFKNCTALTSTPELSATTLAEGCYYGMFEGCTALTRVPSLPATTLKTSCYEGMFMNCTGIKLYADGTGDTWSIPSGATGPEGWGINMFKSTGGTLLGQPVPGTTYYYSLPPVAKVEINGETTPYETIEEAWNAARAGTPGNPATLTLLTNVTTKSTLVIPDPAEAGAVVMTLDLNGCVLQQTAKGARVILNNGGTLTVKDSHFGEPGYEHYFAKGEGGWSLTDTPTAYVVKGGVITGGSPTDVNGGGAIANIGENGGTLTIASGNIAGNTTAAGGGICNMNTLTVSGGAICYNYATELGGGIRNLNDMTVSGGAIHDNEVYSTSQGSGAGGGIANTGMLYISGGEIYGNKAFNGGGVYNVTDLGTGVMAELTMIGGVIRDNATTSLIDGTAGLCNYEGASASLTGGAITNNLGVGVMHKGATLLSLGGTIVIEGSAGAAGLYLQPGNVATVDENTPLASGAKICVTTQNAPTPSAPIQITTNGTAEDANYFQSDAGYPVEKLEGQDGLWLTDPSGGGYITFASDGPGFSLTAAKTWNGTLKYSFDAEHWTTWEGGTIEVPMSEMGSVLYIGGEEGITNITGAGAAPWVIESNDPVSCLGNIETLRGASGDAPSPTQMAEHCYENMFSNCTVLTSTPTLPATDVRQHCYQAMFMGCTSLTRVPELPSTVGATDCYKSMFEGCTGIALYYPGQGEEKWAVWVSQSKGSEYWGQDMFKGTSGTLTGAPVAGRYYYYEEGTGYAIATETAGSGSGTVTTDAPSGALAGDTITVTATPGEGSQLDSLEVYHTADPKQTVPVQDNKFTMPSANVTVKATFSGGPVPPMPTDDCITFSSTGAFTLKNKSTIKEWDGTLWTSTDKENWSEWYGGEVESGMDIEGNSVLYVRGDANNTVISGNENDWVLTGSAGIACSGNIETLRGATGKDPSPTQMGKSCYASLFANCTLLTRAPELPATNLVEECYAGMFGYCSSLTEAPELPATTLAGGCYAGMFCVCTSLTRVPELPATNLVEECYSLMFVGCSGITLYADGTGDTWSIPSGATVLGNWGESMFDETGGTLQGQPEIGTTYYYTPATPTEPEITNVAAMQRYPWNGLVDIAYTVQGTIPDNYELKVWAVDGGTTNMATTITAEASPLATGTHTLKWDMNADGFSNVVDSVVFTVAAVEPEDPPPVPEGVQLWANGPYFAEKNIGAKTPQEYGYHFWWGDTIGYIHRVNESGDEEWTSSDGSGQTISFDEANCPTYNKSIGELYATGWIDENGNLLPGHDAATVHLGSPWRMMTDAEFQQLVDTKICTWKAVTDDDDNLIGYTVTGATEGYTDKSIFLPVTGIGTKSSHYAKFYGIYFSSTPSSDLYLGVRGIIFDSDGFRQGDIVRHQGVPIRPVQSAAANDAAVAAANGVIISGDSTPVKVDLRTGTVREIAQGTTEILTYSTDYASGPTPPKQEGVQLWAGGPYFAEKNIGAESSTDYGYYFWWGDTVGYQYVNMAWTPVGGGNPIAFSDSEPANSTYNKDNEELYATGWIDENGNLVSDRDAATAHLKSPWRMMTGAEMNALISNCDWNPEYDSDYNFIGCTVRGREAYAQNSIFLPSAGYGDGSNLLDTNANGNYWSSTPYSGNSTNAWSINLIEGYGVGVRYFGYPIRPVQSAAANGAASGASNENETVTITVTNPAGVTETLISGQSGFGTVPWTPSATGTNELHHIVYAADGSTVITNIVAYFYVQEATTYNISVVTNPPEGGSVTGMPESSAAGVEIFFTVTADESSGYSIGEVTAAPDAGGKKIKVVDRGGGTYSFVMPAESVTVTATFTQGPTPTEPEITNVAAMQRYPWNGLVDIAYTVQGTIPDNYELKVWAVDGGTTNMATTITAEASPLATGTHTLKWDMNADGFSNVVDSVVFTVAAVEPEDPPPVPEGVQLWADGPYFATTNIGADNPQDYGYYFWWGDTVGYVYDGKGWTAVDKSGTITFEEKNCPTCGLDVKALLGNGWIDKNGNLLPGHDAATAHLGSPWRMMTDAEFQKLVDTKICTWKAQTDAKGKFIGYTVSGATEGYTGNSIFLPAAGHGLGSNYITDGPGFYCSSTPVENSNDASRGLFFESNNYTLQTFPRYFGFPIRPVQSAAANGAAVTAANGVIISGDSTPVKVDLRTGTVREIAQGTTEILTYSTDYASGPTPPKQEGVQLWAGGPYFAETNIGADNPQDYGYYFWWGDTVGYVHDEMENAWMSADASGQTITFAENDKTASQTYGKSIKDLQDGGWIDENGNLVSGHDAATVHLGSPWRMPTYEEIDALVSGCKWQEVTDDAGNYIGHKVSGTGEYAQNSIFLPAAGRGDGSDLGFTGFMGYYWSSTPNSDASSNAWGIRFSEGAFGSNSAFRYGGLPIRPVQSAAANGAASGAGNENETVTITVTNPAGVTETLISGQSGFGTVDWTPSATGTNELHHIVYAADGSTVITNIVAYFYVQEPPPLVKVRPLTEAGTEVWGVYTNGQEVVADPKTGFWVVSNATVDVEFRAKAEWGCFFKTDAGYLSYATNTVTASAPENIVIGPAPVQGTQVGESTHAFVDDGVCTIVGSGSTWEGSKNPLNRAEITSVVVQDGVTGIGAQFFHKFRKIRTVTLAASVTNVADYAFFRCESIDTIAFGAEFASVKHGTEAIAYYLAIKMDEATGQPVTYTVPEVTYNDKPPPKLGTESLENPNWELVEPGQEVKYHFFKLAPMK